MKIGLNLLFMLPGETGGIQTCALALVRELSNIDAHNTYYLFINRESVELQWDLPSNFVRVLCPIKAKNRVVRYAWEQFVLPFQVLSFGIDLLHSLAYVGPIAAPCLQFVTIHDVNFLAWGAQSMAATRRVFMGGICCLQAHRAEVVVAVSGFAREEIIDRLKVPRENVLVVSNAADERQAATKPTEASDPYIVAFGGGDDNKNVVRLIEAFERIAPTTLLNLVLIGRPSNKVSTRIAALPEVVRKRVQCLGFVDEETKWRTLEGATMFVFPSFYEGFGIPILEANSVGIPVVCANATSLPEVAGDAAVYFDPYNVDEIAKALFEVASDEKRRAQLRKAGYENAKRFSWRRSGKILFHLYMSVAGNRKKRIV